MSLGKRYQEILEKLQKNMGSTFPKHLKKHLDGNFVIFSRQFLEELTKN